MGWGCLLSPPRFCKCPEIAPLGQAGFLSRSLGNMVERPPSPGPGQSVSGLRSLPGPGPCPGQLSAQVLEAQASHQTLPDRPTQVRSQPCPLQGLGTCFLFQNTPWDRNSCVCLCLSA